MSNIRVLVVDDSLTVRKHIVDLLSAAPGFEVAGEASDGKAAIELCEKLRPDVVTMDMMLPIMTGLAATEYIMAYCPTPILIVSASTNRGELFKTYDALAAGAVDVLEKPQTADVDEGWNHELLSALRILARIRVITHPRARLSGMRTAPTSPRAQSDPVSTRCDVVAIGASTGGPAALLQVFNGLGESFGLPILLVLHISEPFGSAMAEWLDALLRVPVRFARDGERIPEPGGPCVLMAPPDRHLQVEGRRLRLTDGAERHSCRPSVDVLFESLAREYGARATATLLTGMGRDGAAGMLAIREAGGFTIAQDEATSVVFGMPGEAVRLGAACAVLPLGAIADELMTVARHGR